MAAAAPRKRAPDPVAVLRGHTCDVQALAFLPDGRLLAGCARCGHTAAARSRSLTPRNAHGGRSDADGTIKLWDVGVRRAAHSASAHSASAGVLGVGAAPCDARALLTQGRDGTLKHWQVRVRASGASAAWYGP